MKSGGSERDREVGGGMEETGGRSEGDEGICPEESGAAEEVAGGGEEEEGAEKEQAGVRGGGGGGVGEGGGEERRVGHDGPGYCVEDKGREDMWRVSERRLEMLLAGDVITGQGLPFVQCLEGQVHRGGAGVFRGQAFEEEEGGHG